MTLGCKFKKLSFDILQKMHDFRLRLVLSDSKEDIINHLMLFKNSVVHRDNLNEINYGSTDYLVNFLQSKVTILDLLNINLCNLIFAIVFLDYFRLLNLIRREERSFIAKKLDCDIDVIPCLL
jgi:hypothetical protein